MDFHIGMHSDGTPIVLSPDSPALLNLPEDIQHQIQVWEIEAFEHQREFEWLRQERESLFQNLQQWMTQYEVLQDAYEQARAHATSLDNQNTQLRKTILGYVLEAGFRQNIEPPGDWEDYPFSEDTQGPKE